MAELQINESSIPDLQGQVAVVTGGATGIGHAAAEVLAQRGAKVHILDIREPNAYSLPSLVEYRHCDVSSWSELSKAFLSIDRIDMVFANAAVTEEKQFLADLDTDGQGGFLEPANHVIDINLKATLNVVKLAIHAMRKQESGGRIVLTSSSTAFLPELSLPLYSAMKLALVGLVRSLRINLPKYNIAINAVAPAATFTPMLAAGSYAQCMTAAKLPMSSARFVALALVFSATAYEDRRVEVYANDGDLRHPTPQRWNGRVIVTLGDTYTEVEESLADLCPSWLGERNTELIRAMQAATKNI